MTVRHDRLASELVRVLAEVVRAEFGDPRLAVVTFTRGILSRDHKQATVGYSVLGSMDDRGAAALALEKAASRMRVLVGRAMKLRSTPELHFKYDRGLEEAVRLGELFDEAGLGGSETKE